MVLHVHTQLKHLLLSGTRFSSGPPPGTLSSGFPGNSDLLPRCEKLKNGAFHLWENSCAYIGRSALFHKHMLLQLSHWARCFFQFWRHAAIHMFTTMSFSIGSLGGFPSCLVAPAFYPMIHISWCMLSSAKISGKNRFVLHITWMSELTQSRETLLSLLEIPLGIWYLKLLDAFVLYMMSSIH